MNEYQHHKSLGHLTGLASRLYNRLLTLRFKASGIAMTAEQWGVILTLQNNDNITQRQISELLYLEKSSVSRAIDVLEKRGWVERKPSPHDSRSKLVVLTEQSLEVVERCTVIAEQVLIDSQVSIDQTEIQNSQRYLSEVVGNLRRLTE